MLFTVNSTRTEHFSSFWVFLLDKGCQGAGEPRRWCGDEACIHIYAHISWFFWLQCWFWDFFGWHCFGLRSINNVSRNFVLKLDAEWPDRFQFNISLLYADNLYLLSIRQYIFLYFIPHSCLFFLIWSLQRSLASRSIPKYFAIFACGIKLLLIRTDS